VYIDKTILTSSRKMANPSFSQWTLVGQNGIESLNYATTKLPANLGENEVIVELRAASLNYRDIVIAQVRITLRIAHVFSYPYN
jgi:NADPH:quinone reductase-like Zn-dependent oxidoreductase